MHIDYYVSLNSPWTHLGAARLEAMVARHGASVRVFSAATLSRLIAEVGLDAPALSRLGAKERWAERHARDTQDALARGVFEAPSYVTGDEIFWGQDRLEFVERRLAAG